MARCFVAQYFLVVNPGRGASPGVTSHAAIDLQVEYASSRGSAGACEGDGTATGLVAGPRARGIPWERATIDSQRNLILSVK